MVKLKCQCKFRKIATNNLWSSHSFFTLKYPSFGWIFFNFRLNVSGKVTRIGLGDVNHEGLFRWMCRETLGYEVDVWASGQPDGGRTENCVGIDGNNKLRKRLHPRISSVNGEWVNHYSIEPSVHLWMDPILSITYWNREMTKSQSSLVSMTARSAPCSKQNCLAWL